MQKRVEFKYDAWGNRIEKKVDADGNGSFETTQKFAYDGWNPAKPSPIGTENFDVWADLDGTGSLTTQYLRGDVVDELFARMESAGDSWYHNDRLGSIRDITNSSGAVIDSLTYDGFGNIISETNSANRGRYAWTGREIDTEIALQHNRARYYDAATGRWISQDPLGFDAGDGNLYRYTKNVPQIYRDPSGLQDQELTRLNVEFYFDKASPTVNGVRLDDPAVRNEISRIFNGILVNNDPKKLQSTITSKCILPRR